MQVRQAPLDVNTSLAKLQHQVMRDKPKEHKE